MRILTKVRHLPHLYLIIILFTAVFSVLYQGYYFGQLDGSIFIPYLKSIANPTLYLHDFFIQTWNKEFFANLWRILALFSEFIPLQLLIFSFHIITRFFFYLAIYSLARYLFKNKLAGYLGVILWAIPKPTLGFEILYNNFVQSAVGTPLLLFSLYFFFKKKYSTSAVLLGIAFHIHPPMAGFVFASFLFSLLMQRILKNFLTVFFTTSFIAFPILFQAILFQKNKTGYDAIWIELTRIRSSHHSFPLEWPPEAWIPFMAYLLLFFLCLPFVWRYIKEKLVYFSILFVMFGIIISGFIFAEIIPIAKIIVMVPFHVSPILSVLLSFPIIYAIVLLFSKKSWLYQSLSIILFQWFFFSAFFPNVFKTAFFVSTGLTLIALCLFVIFNRFLRIPLWHIYLPIFFASILFLWMPFMLKKNITRKDTFYNDWVAIQKWTRQHTNTEAVFIVPVYQEGFRVHSERAIVADWKDGTAGYLSPVYLKKWWQIMRDFGLTKNYYNDYYQKKNYWNMSTTKIKDLAKKYGAGYLVVETKKNTYHFQKVYGNNHFVLFKL